MGMAVSRIPWSLTVAVAAAVREAPLKPQYSLAWMAYMNRSKTAAMVFAPHRTPSRTFQPTTKN